MMTKFSLLIALKIIKNCNFSSNDANFVSNWNENAMLMRNFELKFQNFKSDLIKNVVGCPIGIKPALVRVFFYTKP